MTKKTVVVANTGEAFAHETLQMRSAQARRHQMLFDQSLGERGLLWAGDHKLVVTAQPVPDRFLKHIRNALGYRTLEALCPTCPSLSLAEDIWSDKELFSAILAFCGSDPVDLIPFAGTVQFLELADRLRASGARIDLPESTTRQNLWVRDYLDSKAGFRLWASTVVNQLEILKLPQGYICRNYDEAAAVIYWFLDRDTRCLVKASRGAGGEGLTTFDPAMQPSLTIKEIAELLRSNPYFTDDLLIVEELITADRSIAGGSPSVDIFIPQFSRGEPDVLCLSGQLLTESGGFIGIEIRDDILLPVLAEKIRRDSLRIAHHMRQMGYVGPFDIDLIAAQDGSLYMVEFNMRRTGGSHAIDVGRHLYGPDFASRVTILSANKPLTELRSLSYNDLELLLSDLFYPMGDCGAGLILTNISLLEYGSFGYLILAPEREQAYAIRDEMSAWVNRLVPAAS
jgi:hypothetical protein